MSASKFVENKITYRLLCYFISRDIVQTYEFSKRPPNIGFVTCLTK